MESIWFKNELADEIIKNSNIMEEIPSVVTDIISGNLDITKLVENMAGVLTNKEAENRERGMRFFTKVLTELPKEFLTEMQIKFIAKFYIDRLKDNHRVIPAVLEGYLAIVDMKNYCVQSSGEFFSVLFREVACQSQVRQDRFYIYLIVKKVMEKDTEYMKTLGPDFMYGVISSIDGEREPRNLLFLFHFLPKFLAHIPLGHLTEEMFEVISCYYPIDFHPSPNDPTAVTREELASALTPCLCAVPEFGEQCLVLLIEKLDSSLRVAKLDSLKLLAESCNTFKAETYGPFLKTLWSSLHKEITHKTDEEIKMTAHEALSALVAKLASTANTDQTFENFVKGVLISMQTALAGSTTVAQFVQATKVLLTTANASKDSCMIIIKSMIPAIAAYYEFKTTSKLQLACLEFFGELYELAKHWNLLDEIDTVLHEIPQLCLLAVSQTSKEYQIAGFKTLIRVKDIVKSDLILPLVEILIYNIQNSQDRDLLKVSVETVHAIARKYPEIIMSLVVKGKCDLNNLLDDKSNLQKRLNLLSNLASIDEFTKVIIEEMLNIISVDKDNAPKVIEALHDSISDTNLYTHEKVSQIESDHGLIDSLMNWLLNERKAGGQETLTQTHTLISTTVSSLSIDKQKVILDRYTSSLLNLCNTDEIYFMIIECLYSSMHRDVHDTKIEQVMSLSLKLSLESENDTVREKACSLVACILNKAEYGQTFEFLYEQLKTYLATCPNNDVKLCPRLIHLYGWITKALVLRGSDKFLFWLEKIFACIANQTYCKNGAAAIGLIMTDFLDSLNTRKHCRISPLYRQRMFQSFSMLAAKHGPPSPDTKESYLLSWAYILDKTPKSVLNNEADQISPLLIDALEYDNKELLLVVTDVLCHYVQAKNATIAYSLQTILPRLIKLSTYVKSMDVRIKSLQCLYEIANSYKTVILLPHKQDVLLDMAPSLDDRKRLVRNMAVRARTRWFLVGAPGESKED